MTTRRFPTPWSIRGLEQAFRIEDANGQAVAYTYFRKDENTARQANVLTHDEAQRIAANIAKLPEMLSCKDKELTIGDAARPNWREMQASGNWRTGSTTPT